MPYPNEHAARINNPNKYQRIRRQNDKFGSGIDAIFGVTADGKAELQAIRFDKKKFTPAQARKWLKDHNYSASLETASGKEIEETYTGPDGETVSIVIADADDKEAYTVPPATEAAITHTISTNPLPAFVTTSSGEGSIIITPNESKEVKNMMMNDEMPMAMSAPMGGACSWDEMEAMEEAEGLTKAYYKMSDQMGMMAHNIMRNPTIEDKAGALADLATGYADRVKKVADGDMPHEGMMKEADNLSPTFIDKLKGWLGSQITGNQSEQASKSKPDTGTNQDAPGGDRDGNITTDTHKNLFIWKEGDTYRWLAAYSNNRRDEDNPPEIISSESHKEFDQALQKGQWPMPELYLWHVPYPVGTTQYHAYDESSGFPIAAGVFNKGMEWAAEGIIQAGWDGVSHGMPSEWIRRDEKDPTIVIRHRTKEISFLPLWAAANKLTFNIINKETIMAEQEKGLPAHKREDFVKAFGEEQVTKIETALADKAKEADEAGIEKKEETPTEAASAALTPDNPVVKALAMVVEQLTALDTRLKAIEEKQTAEAEEKEQPFDLIEFLKSKSAIGKPETKVDGRTVLAKGPEEAKQSSFTEAAGGMRIGVADQFIQANQAWYQNTGGAN